MAEYLTYWKYQTAARAEGTLLLHAASEQYGKITPGDILWFVTYKGGTLYLVGCMEVARLVGQREAERLLQSDNLWEATYHVLAKPDTAAPVTYISLKDVAPALRFEGGVARLPPDFTAQSFRSLRQLTAESADLLRVVWSTGSAEPHGISAASAAGQGFAISHPIRKSIDSYTMHCAISYFQTAGYAVEDTSTGNPFDLRCRSAAEDIFVEVKGTQTQGRTVILTANEVEFARRHKRRMALFIMHSVQVEECNGKVLASGGQRHIIQPWDVDHGTLVATQYVYTPG